MKSMRLGFEWGSKQRRSSHHLMTLLFRSILCRITTRTEFLIHLKIFLVDEKKCRG